ncbi:21524_t:CDS:1, partial [Rhizophagus irregularis]
MGGHISGLTYVFLVSYNFKSVGQQEDIDAKDDSNDYSKYVKMNETL